MKMKDMRMMFCDLKTAVSQQQRTAENANSKFLEQNAKQLQDVSRLNLQRAV